MLFRLSKIKNEEAVSEVVGTILILAITVVLFATVFVYVQQVPLATAPEQVTIYQEISYDANSHVLYENLSDKGGSILLRSETYLIVLVNNVEYSSVLTSLQVSDPYGNASKYFEPGDSILWNSSSIGAKVSNGSKINSILFYKSTNQVLWQSENDLPVQYLLTDLFALQGSQGTGNETLFHHLLSAKHWQM